jgi:hypothetical protein
LFLEVDVAGMWDDVGRDVVDGAGRGGLSDLI